MVQKAVPVFRNLRLTVARPGQANDAGELLALLPAVQKRAARSFPHAEQAISDFQPNLNFARAYTPDFFNGLAKLGQITGYYDANGHYARVSFSDLNLFSDSGGELKRSRRASSTKRSAARERQAPLPRRRHPVGRRRLQPVRRTGDLRRRRQHLRMQPGDAPRTMKPQKALIASPSSPRSSRSSCSAPGAAAKGYVVRGIFDNGSFMVKGEQVRVAGANVGEIESVGVTMPGEVDTYVNGKPKAVEGKAVIVMKITDPGFQDFRQDASCLIRPQSLIGEKYVDCRPTLPRAPGTQPPPPLHKIPSGQTGAGEYLLPFANNSTTVDPDLINDIQTPALRAALPADLQRTRRRPGGARRRHRSGRQARQPLPARRRPGDPDPHPAAGPPRPARLRLRADHSNR